MDTKVMLDRKLYITPMEAMVFGFITYDEYQTRKKTKTEFMWWKKDYITNEAAIFNHCHRRLSFGYGSMDEKSFLTRVYDMIQSSSSIRKIHVPDNIHDLFDKIVMYYSALFTPHPFHYRKDGSPMNPFGLKIRLKEGTCFLNNPSKSPSPERPSAWGIDVQELNELNDFTVCA